MATDDTIKTQQLDNIFGDPTKTLKAGAEIAESAGEALEGAYNTFVSGAKARAEESLFNDVENYLTQQNTAEQNLRDLFFEAQNRDDVEKVNFDGTIVFKDLNKMKDLSTDRKSEILASREALQASILTNKTLMDSTQDVENFLTSKVGKNPFLSNQERLEYIDEGKKRLRQPSESEKMLMEIRNTQLDTQYNNRVASNEAALTSAQSTYNEVFGEMDDEDKQYGRGDYLQQIKDYQTENGITLQKDDEENLVNSIDDLLEAERKRILAMKDENGKQLYPGYTNISKAMVKRALGRVDKRSSPLVAFVGGGDTELGKNWWTANATVQADFAAALREEHNEDLRRIDANKDIKALTREQFWLNNQEAKKVGEKKAQNVLRGIDFRDLTLR
jgi:hypothetical protein